MHQQASDDGDAHLADFLETHYLDEQVKAAKELSDLITKMVRAGEGIGLHIIDKEMAEK
jgi:ferritin heavy chain